MPKQHAASARRADPFVKLSPRGAARLQSRHPWVYRSDIMEANDVPPGAMVRVLDQRGKFLGTALYSSSSQIAIRLISHGSVADLPSLVAERIRSAVAYRKNLVSNTDAYRIVFSEADSLPGLIVDRYNDVVSVQMLTQAMDAAPVREAILQTLAEGKVQGEKGAPICQDEQPSTIAGDTGSLRLATTEAPPLAGIVERVDARIDIEQLPPRTSGLLWGEKSSTVVNMNGVRFHYDGLEGQKTGAFLDQRENYAAAAEYAHGEALDAFCYQGGFSRPMPLIFCESTRPQTGAMTRSFLIPQLLPRPSAISTKLSAVIRNLTCAP